MSFASLRKDNKPIGRFEKRCCDEQGLDGRENNNTNDLNYDG